MDVCRLLCSLVRPANLQQLVDYVLQTPADEENEKLRYKLVLCMKCLVFKLTSNC